MKKILCFIVVLFSFTWLSAQSSECLFRVELIDGDSLTINAGSVKYVRQSNSGIATIIQGDYYKTYSTTHTISELVTLSNGEIIKFTDADNGLITGISRAFISEVRETRIGTAVIVAENPKFAFTTVETFLALQPFLQACANGGGSIVPYTGTNVGAGVNVYKQTNLSNEHEFRTITGGNNVTVNQIGDLIQITSDAMDTLLTSSEFNGPIEDGDTLTLLDNSVSGSRLQDLAVTTGKIADDAVDFAKMQHIGSNRLLGRHNGGTGPVEQIIVGSGLNLNTGGILSVTAVPADPDSILVKYPIGSDAYASADSLGITFSTAAGVGTVVVPKSVEWSALIIKGQTSDLAGDNSYKVVIDHDPSVPYNQSYSTMMPPDIQVLNTAAVNAAGPSDALPFIYDEGSTPQRQITAVGSGDITLRVINLDAFTDWVIIITQ